MLVSTLQIVAKIKDLPPDYAEHVHITGNPTREAGGTAEVESFSNPLQAEPYIVHIQVAEAESNLNVTCTCPATKLCLHVVAFYAVFKGITPPVAEPVLLPLEEEDISTPHVDEAKETPSEEIEDTKSTDKQRVEIYDQISAAFAKLAVLEEEE